MSADTCSDPATARRNSSRVPPLASTERSSCLPSQAPRAPVADTLPISSLSNRTSALTCWLAGSPATAASADTQACEHSRSSSRAELTNSSSAPASLPPVRSYVIRSWLSTSWAGMPSSAPMSALNAPLSAGPCGGAHDHPAGEPELAVEPGIEQRAAVDLDADLADAGRAGVRAGLDPQRRAVGMRAEQPGRRVRGRPP